MEKSDSKEKRKNSSTYLGYLGLYLQSKDLHTASQELMHTCQQKNCSLTKTKIQIQSRDLLLTF